MITTPKGEQNPAYELLILNHLIKKTRDKTKSQLFGSKKKPPKAVFLMRTV